MADRKVKSQINRSESLARVSEGAELLFRQLILYVDAKGEGDTRISQIVAGCAPLRRKNDYEEQCHLTRARLVELVQEGCVELIRDAKGTPVRLRLTGWATHQKRPRTRKEVKRTAFPTEPETLQKLAEQFRAWWEREENLRRYGQPDVMHAIDTCKDWAESNGHLRADWFAVLCNGVRKGWLVDRRRRHVSPDGRQQGAAALLTGQEDRP